MCAFDLLATVAGKLLVGKDSSPSSINLSTKHDQFAINGGYTKEEFHGPLKQLELQPYDQAASEMRNLSSKPVANDGDPDNSFKEAKKAAMGYAEIKASPDGLASEKLGKGETGYCDEKIAVESAEYLKSSNYKLNDETERKNVVELPDAGNAPHDSGTNVYSFGDQVVWDAKPLVQISADSNANISFKDDKERAPHNIFSQCKDNVALDSKDDDENSSGCSYRSTSKKSFTPAPCMGDRRIRKVLASKYQKVAIKWKEKLFPRNGKLTR